MNKKVSAFIFSLLLGIGIVSAQRGPEVGLWLGGATYYGDLSTQFNMSDANPGGGLNFRYNFNPRISYKFSLNYMSLNADDADSPNNFERIRNLSFHTDIFDMTHQLEFNFLPYIHGSKDEFYTPYLFGGVSTLFYNPKANLDFNGDGTSETYVLRDFGTEGQAFGAEYGRFTYALNFGIGIKFDINVDWSINLEFGGRSTFTDYLDDVSTVYPDFNDLAQNRGDIAVALSNRAQANRELINPGTQRGNSNDRDHYYVFGISIMRYFGTLPCPKLGRPN